MVSEINPFLFQNIFVQKYFGSKFVIIQFISIFISRHVHFYMNKFNFGAQGPQGPPKGPQGAPGPRAPPRGPMDPTGGPQGPQGPS